MNSLKQIHVGTPQSMLDFSHCIGAGRWGHSVWWISILKKKRLFEMCFWLQQLGWFYLLTFCYVCKYQQLKVIMIFFLSVSFTSWEECGLISLEIFRFFFICGCAVIGDCLAVPRKNIRCQVTWNIVNSCFALHIPLAVENVRYLCKFLPSMCVCVWNIPRPVT